MSSSHTFIPTMVTNHAGCIFCDIVAGKAPASIVHRDERCIVFMDIRPVTPGHLLVIPLAHAPYLADLEPTVGGHLFTVAQRLAAGIRRSGLRADGVDFFLADGEAAGQEIIHVRKGPDACTGSILGRRTARIIDPSGHVWTVASRLEETTEEQRSKRWAEIRQGHQ